MTPWERKLWYEYLRQYPLRFQRQKAIGNYIVDFYCAKARLVVEFDVVDFMTFEKSCGAVVFTRSNNKIRYLLIRNLAGIYGFPKGHAELGETEEETALREVFEEVGLTITLVPGFRSEDEHPIPQKENTMKHIVYFLGEYNNQEFNYQKEELTDALLVDYQTAMVLFQFDSSKRILTAANNFLLSRSEPI